MQVALETELARSHFITHDVDKKLNMNAYLGARLWTTYIHLYTLKTAINSHSFCLESFHFF